MLGTPYARFVFLFAALSCGSRHESITSDAGGTATPPDSASAAPPTSASATKPPDRKSALRQGRALAQAGDWEKARQALAFALEAAPDDPIVLAEMGWAELNDGDLAASEATSDHALEVVKEPRVRAQVLYNLGRVAEARGDIDRAKAQYTESLALRPNHNVEERLESIGGKPPKAAASASTSPPASTAAPSLACDRAFANLQALCDCLVAQKDRPSSDKPTCGAEASAPKRDDSELAVIRWGGVLLLAANAKGGLKPVLELGRDSDADDSRARQTAHVVAFDERTSGGRHVTLVKTEQTYSEESDGGAELFTSRTLQAAVCVLRDETHPTKCPFVTPLEIDESLRSKQGYERKARFDIGFADDKATVTQRSGPVSMAPPRTLGDHPLW